MVRWPAESAGTSPVHLAANGQISAAHQPPQETLDNLLDRVSTAREELVAVERALERLRSDITKLDNRKGESRKTR